MDNFHIDLTAEPEVLAAALRLVFEQNCPGGKATHYTVTHLREKVDYYANIADAALAANVDLSRLPAAPGAGLHIHHHEHLVEDRQKGHETLILHWGTERTFTGITQLLYPHTIEETIPFVHGWLKHANAGPKPDIDGDCAPAFRLFTQYWGNLEGHPYAICAIQSVWALLGK